MQIAGAGGTLLATPGLAEAKARISAPLHKLAVEAKDIKIKSVTTFDVVVPQSPGLGLNIDEAALKHYRVADLQGGRRPAAPPAR